jgi:uncharacterized membrane protein YqjE
MATDVHPGTQPSVSSLVTGIVNDTQALVKQHLELFRTEVKEDVRKTKQAAIPLIIGVVVMGVGGLLLCFTLVHLLYALTYPNLLLWHCYAIVTGAFLVVGAILVFVGKKQFDSFNPLPDQTLKEMQWTIKPK